MSSVSDVKNNASVDSSKQLTTFVLNENLFGIDVMRVQEVTKSAEITKIPLAPAYVKGLINLRGQIVTAIGLSELLGLEKTNNDGNNMMVVCKVDGNLLSLIVDSIGDVVELSMRDFEDVPDTYQLQLKKFMDGVFKTDAGLVSVVDIEKLYTEINKI